MSEQQPFDTTATIRLTVKKGTKLAEIKSIFPVWLTVTGNVEATIEAGKRVLRLEWEGSSQSLIESAMESHPAVLNYQISNYTCYDYGTPSVSKSFFDK